MNPNVTKEERARALKICSEHLDGAWKEVQLSELNICKLSGGMSNLLYYCALPDTVNTYKEEPKQILLRIYGPSHGDTDIQLEIFNQLAAENLGPVLYGTFNEGRLEEYLPSSPLSWSDLTNDDVSAVVARKIAAIHRLNVDSLNRGSNWLINKYNHYNEFIVMSIKSPPPFKKDTLQSTRDIALELIAIDFKLEIEYLTSLIQNLNVPLVFSHNDLHQNNILLLHNLDKDLNLDDRIVLIDFEYCDYNYRTFDAANHLSEWCFDYNGDEYPYFSASTERFPSEAKQRQFLKHYVNQMSDLDLNGKGQCSFSNGQQNESDKIDILFNEMQPFLMASNLLWALWAIKSAYTSKIKFGYWEMAKWKWGIYLFCKERFKHRFEPNLGCEGDLIVRSSKM